MTGSRHTEDGIAERVAARIGRLLDELRCLVGRERALEREADTVRGRQLDVFRRLRRLGAPSHRIGRALALGWGLRPRGAIMSRLTARARKRLSRRRCPSAASASDVLSPNSDAPKSDDGDIMV